MVAYTMFDGNEYGVPAEMLDECDMYVVDIEGVKTLRERYNGKDVVVVYLDITSEEAASRMRARGDSEEKIQRRLANDKVMFADLDGLAADYVLDANGTKEETIERLCNVIVTTL
jgi:guanylate kinase